MKIKFNIEFFTKWGEELYVELDKPYKLAYTNNGIWCSEIRFNPAQEQRIIEYRYFVKNSLGNIFYEAGKRRSIAVSSSTTAIEAYDYWCPNGADAPFLTAPFSEVLHKNCSAHRIYTHRSNNEIIISVVVPNVGAEQKLLICGNTPELGEWQPGSAKEMRRVEGERWIYSIDGSSAKGTLFKFILSSPTKEGEAKYEWEEGKNREIPIENRSRHKTVIIEQGLLSFNTPAPKIAGCAVPLFSLRSRNSWGVGDFGDLKLLIDWAAESGQRIIQLLPINDTTSTGSWADSYPYNSISVFALHPIYINLAAFGPLGESRQDKELARDKKRLNNEYSLNYPEVWELKSNYCGRLYKEIGNESFAEPGFYTFTKENSEWLYGYAAFCALREHFKEYNFRKWGAIEHNGKKIECAHFSKEIIEALRERDCSLNNSFNFYIWIQYILHKQLLECKEYAHKKGVALKGDIPIGVSRYGVESWQHPALFNFEMQAGAPPDAFSDEGQNWGFPTYNWEQMAKDNYSWWKSRLLHLQRYFDAYRIDHILGFFRIWEIPITKKESRYGHFCPALPLSTEEIERYGLPLSRALFIKDPYCKKGYHPAILAKKSERYSQLCQEDKEKFNALYNSYFFSRHNTLWYKNGVKKLQQLIAATNMLPCGEDLGMLSNSVTECMQNLNILSLEVLMMPKNFGADLGKPEEYQYKSVCTTSTHDSPTLRMWLAERLSPNGEVKDASAAECLKVVEQILQSKSMLAILPIQDWFSIEPRHRNRYFTSERINDPSNPQNQWKYRIDCCLEDLVADTQFTDKIKRVIESSGRL